jgi:hypothetical protein
MFLDLDKVSVHFWDEGGFGAFDINEIDGRMIVIADVRLFKNYLVRMRVVCFL